MDMSKLRSIRILLLALIFISLLPVIAVAQTDLLPSCPPNCTTRDQAKAAIDALKSEALEICAREDLQPHWSKTACNPEDTTLEQMADKSRITNAEKVALSKGNAESKRIFKETLNIFRRYYPQLVPSAIARRELLDKVTMDFYEGRITRGEYNKRRMETSNKLREDLAAPNKVDSEPTTAVAQSHLPPCPADPNVVWTNCIGTRSHPNGDKIIAEATDGRANGQGTYIWANGRKYVGEFRDDKINGHGTETWPDGSKYVGEFRDGAPNGQGTLTWANGVKYVGQFSEGRQNGHGTLTWPNGDKYVGELRDDAPNGQGTFTWADGRKYVGEFRGGKTNGQGTLTWPNGGKYVGGFKDDEKSGQGTLTAPEGNTYVGEFRDDQPNGQGAFTWPDGSKYEGQVEKGFAKGRGTFTSPTGVQYTGEFQGGISWLNRKVPPNTRVDVYDAMLRAARERSVEPVQPNHGIPIEVDGGTFIVPVTINDQITLKFMIDSGATDVAVPADVVLTLIRTGSITEADFLGEKQYVLADGSTVPSQIFTIRSLKVGDKVLENVRASVASVKGSLLLGQSFLNRFSSWAVDNKNRLLFLHEKSP
jgi:clan AA aspartic protease (TIGR02281 family)